MKSLNAKFVLSTFVVVAMLTSPAFAKKPQQDTRNHASSVYAPPVYSAIPGYDSEGNVVATPDPDQSDSSRVVLRHRRVLFELFDGKAA